MKQRDRLVLTCSCEGTMPVDGDAIAASGCGELPETPHQLCRMQLDRFREALATGRPMTVTCTQEQPPLRGSRRRFRAGRRRKKKPETPTRPSRISASSISARRRAGRMMRRRRVPRWRR